MAYCTVNDITGMLPRETLIQLSDDEALGAVDTTRVDEAIAQAGGEIDSYCGERYGVPVTPTPAVLKKLSVDIAIYNLYSRRVTEMPPVRKERYQNSIRTLEAIAKGLVSLGVEPEPQAAADGRAETNLADGGNVFTRDKLKGF